MNFTVPSLEQLAPGIERDLARAPDTGFPSIGITFSEHFKAWETELVNSSQFGTSTWAGFVNDLTATFYSIFDYVKDKVGPNDTRLAALNQIIENCMTNLVHLTSGRLPGEQRFSIFLSLLKIRRNEAIIADVFYHFLTDDFLLNCPRDSVLPLLERFWDCAFTTDNVKLGDRKPYYNYRVFKILEERIYGTDLRYRTDFIKIFETLSREIMDRAPADVKNYIESEISILRSRTRLLPPTDNKPGVGPTENKPGLGRRILDILGLRGRVRDAPMFTLVVSKSGSDVCALSVKSNTNVDVAKISDPAAWQGLLLEFRDLARLHKASNHVEIAQLVGKMVDDGVRYWRVSLEGAREQATVPDTGLLIDSDGKLQFVPWAPASYEAVLASLT